MGGAEVKIVQKKEGMIKLSGEGHMRTIATSASFPTVFTRF